MSRSALAARLAPFDVITAVPASDGTWRQQVRESLTLLEDRLIDSGRELGDVLALTLFVATPGVENYTDHRRRLVAQVCDFFCGMPPPTGVVAQAPSDGRRVALEATVIAAAVDDFPVATRTCGGVRYTLIAGRGSRQIHCSGICSDPALGDRCAQSRDAFEKMEAVLRNEGMTFGHVVRQWGYIERVLEIRSDCAEGHQGYQAFNDVRTLAYESSEFSAGYPAATGIGQVAGGVVLDFVALDVPPDVRVVSLSNPRQTDAHRYSPGLLVGEPLAPVAVKGTPKFERAKLVVSANDEIVLVSGTAAIVGEHSVDPGDVAAQTKTTIDNIAALVGEHRLSYLRAYVKRAEDIPTVRRICEAAFGRVPATYVIADVCRDELLVEVEGALVKTRKQPCEEPRSWPRS